MFFGVWTSVIGSGVIDSAHQRHFLGCLLEIGP